MGGNNEEFQELRQARSEHRGAMSRDLGQPGARPAAVWARTCQQKERKMRSR